MTVAELQELEEVKLLVTKGQTTGVPTWRLEHLDLNTSGGGPGPGARALGDVTVRRAIAQTIDRAALYRATYPLGAEQVGRACSNAPPNSFWTKPDPDGLCPPVDVAAANASLDAAGYARGANGIRTDPARHLPLELRFCASTDPADRAAAEFLADSLGQIGIRLDPTFVDTTTVLEADWSDVDATTACSLARGTFDVALSSSPLGLDLVADYYLSYHSSEIPSDRNDGTGFNYVRMRSPTMDRRLAALRTTIDPAAWVATMAGVQDAYLATAAEIPLYFWPTVATIGRRVHNVALNPTGIQGASDLWNVEDWWMNP